MVHQKASQQELLSEKAAVAEKVPRQAAIVARVPQKGPEALLIADLVQVAAVAEVQAAVVVKALAPPRVQKGPGVDERICSKCFSAANIQRLLHSSETSNG